MLTVRFVDVLEVLNTAWQGRKMHHKSGVLNHRRTTVNATARTKRCTKHHSKQTLNYTYPPIIFFNCRIFRMQ